MKNRFKEKIDKFFKMKTFYETFIVNKKDFDVIVKHWRQDYGSTTERIKEILGHANNIWNVYIRFKPSFPDFEKLPDDYDNFDLIDFNGGATFGKRDGVNKVFGCDYAHYGDEDVMNCEEFNESNRCFTDAHKILKELEQICKGAENGR